MRSRLMFRAFALVTLGAVACAGKDSTKPAAPAPSAETERYFKAVDARFDGDSRGYYDQLLELAHDEPDSRAGRKARAVLQADSALWMVASAGAIASIGIPSFAGFQTKAKETEARSVLESVYFTQSIFFANKQRYCRTFKECAFEVTPSKYVLVMSPKELQMPPETTITGTEVRTALAAVSIRPRIEKKKFLIAAVANLDDDPDLDIWTVDEQGIPTQIMSDTE